jgi:hypothetical protein
MRSDILKIASVGAVVVSAVALPFAAAAAGAGVGGFDAYSLADSAYNVSSLIDQILSYVFGILIVVAVALILYAAFLYMTAGGSDDNIAAAKKYIIYAVIGLAIAFLARAIVGVVTGLLGVA